VYATKKVEESSVEVAEEVLEDLVPEEVTAQPAVNEVAIEPVEEKQQREARGKLVNCKRLNLREAKSLTSGVRMIINQNSKIVVLREEDGWLSVVIDGKVKGFVVSNFVAVV